MQCFKNFINVMTKSTNQKKEKKIFKNQGY